MSTLLAFVYENETDSSENIDSFSGGLRAAHGAADLPVTNKEH